jgi:hypothetical protein
MPLLGDKRTLVEFTQSRNECFAAESADASVEESIGSPGDPVAVAIVGVGEGENRRIGYGVDQTETEHVGRGAQCGTGCARWHRLSIDSHRMV